jgi:hypothetical protein
LSNLGTFQQPSSDKIQIIKDRQMPQALSNSQVQTKFKQQNKKKRQTNATGDN